MLVGENLGEGVCYPGGLLGEFCRIRDWDRICGPGGSQHKMFGHSFPPPRRKNLLESSVGHKEGNYPRFWPKEFQGMEVFPSTGLAPIKRPWIDFVPSSLMALS